MNIFNPVPYLVFVIIFLLILGIIYILKDKKLIHKWTINFIDGYIQKNHSDQFIHKEMIQNEIEKRLKNHEERITKKLKGEEEDKLRAKDLKFAIIENGYIAEISRMEAMMEEVMKLKKENEELYYKNLSRAKELDVITSINASIGQKIIESTAENLGKLESISLDTSSVLKKIEDSREKDNKALMIE